MIPTSRFNQLALPLLAFLILSMAYVICLNYYGISGYNTSDPASNTPMRIMLNNLIPMIYGSAFWIFVGFLSQDYKSALIALFTLLLIHFGVDFFVSSDQWNHETFQKRINIKQFLNLIPWIIFGLSHFKSSKGFKMIFVGLLLLGTSLASNPYPYYEMLDTISSAIGLKGLFEFKFPNSTRPINLYVRIHSQLLMVMHLIIFWWIYKGIKENKKFTNPFKTIESTKGLSSLSFSLIYWGLRLFLFSTGLSLVGSITNSFSGPILQNKINIQRPFISYLMYQLLISSLGCLSLFFTQAIKCMK